MAKDIICYRCEDVICPPGENPFFPLMYLGPEILEELYPYVKAAAVESLGSDRTAAEYIELVNGIRAWLQHYGVFVE